MADKTKIEWADATVNYINGCSVISPGCKHCYAMGQAHRFPVRQGLTQHTAGGMVWTGEVRDNPKALEQVLGWKRGRKIFWNAHGDAFHENVPDEWIDRMFAVCALTPQHTHMILTKRADRMRKYLGNEDTVERVAVERWRKAGPLPALERFWPLKNVWVGVSVEDQKRADERVPDLLATPAAVRFLSCEPLLGPVNIATVPIPLGRYFNPMYGTAAINWVIIGAESGHKARPMQNEWAQSLVDQCATANAACFVKQLSGGRSPIKDIDAFPAGLRVREFPNGR